MTNENYQGQCQCGHVSFTMHAKPLLRVICHCTNCQKFNQADYADILIFDYDKVELPEVERVNYKCYSPLPLVERGKCIQCGQPAIEYLHKAYSPNMVIVPTSNVPDTSIIPDVSFHSFYHRRKKDFDDSAEKVSGFIKSQTAFMVKYLKAKESRKA